jgi:hypothetical protein
MVPGALVAVAGVTVAGGLAGAVLVPAALATAGADHRLAGRGALVVGVALVVWGGLVAAVGEGRTPSVSRSAWPRPWGRCWWAAPPSGWRPHSAA